MSERIWIDAVDPAVRDLFAPDARLKEIATGGQWFEGPAWVGETLIWSDVRGNRLHRYRREEGSSVWIDPSHFQNGHTVDREGRLLAASHGERAVIRRERDGRWIIVADLWDGRRFNSPNDLVVASDGGIWFTDPNYGLHQPEESYEARGAVSEIGAQHVFRAGPRGLREPVLCATEHLPPMPAPNGLAFSPDEQVLYVSDSERRHILGFRVRLSLDGPELTAPWVVHETLEGAPDGIRVDPTGRIWSSSGAGVEILAPPVPGQRATLLGTLRTPQVTANLAFSPDLKRLALTSTSSVYLVKLGDVTV